MIKLPEGFMHLNDIPEIKRLSTPEKILLVEELWDSIASDESEVVVPQSHTAELDKRLAKYKSHQGGSPLTRRAAEKS